MKNFLIAFCVFLVWSFFGLWLFYWLQEENNYLQSNNAIEAPINTTIESDTSAIERNVITSQLETKDSIFEFEEAKITPALRAYTVDGDILFNYTAPIAIVKNEPEVSIPTAAQDFKYKLNNYFIEHPETELHITSKYSAEENIATPNLGIQRAEKLKEILVTTGIPAKYIVIKPHITPIQFLEDNTYLNAFSFLFQPLNLARLDAVKNTIPETKTMYPRFSTQGILQSPELKTLLEEIKLAFVNTMVLLKDKKTPSFDSPYILCWTWRDIFLWGFQSFMGNM